MASRKQIIEAAMRAAVADATYVPPERQIIAELQALRKEMTKPPQQVNYLSLAREFLAQRLSLADDVSRAAKETQADPSDAQKQAGNYAKGHVSRYRRPRINMARAAFDESKHPRGRDGKFIDHEAVSDAFLDVDARRSLLRKLDDENKAKLWTALREHAANRWEEEARGEHSDAKADAQADDDDWRDEAIQELPSGEDATDKNAVKANKKLEREGNPYRIVRVMPDPPLTPEEWDEQNPEPEELDESASDKEYAAWKKAHAAWDKAGDAAIAADKAWTDKYYEKWSEYESPFGLEHKDRPGQPVNLSRGSFKESEHPRGQPGNAGQFVHGQAAKNLHAQHQAFKQARKAAHQDLGQRAKAAWEKIESVAEVFSEAHTELYWDTSDPKQSAFTDFEALVMEYDPDWSASDRFQAMKEIQEAAETALEVELPFGDGEDDFKPEMQEQNHRTLKATIQAAKEGRQAIRDYVKHRKEMQAIKRGEAIDLSRWMPGSLWNFAAAHAPAGYNRAKPLVIAGKPYVGGEFIPASEVAKAPPEVQAQLVKTGQDVPGSKVGRQMPQTVQFQGASDHVAKTKQALEVLRRRHPPGSIAPMPDLPEPTGNPEEHKAAMKEWFKAANQHPYVKTAKKLQEILKPTDHLYKTAEGWHPERKKLHEEFIGNTLGGKRFNLKTRQWEDIEGYNSKPAAGQKPKAVIVIGPPGAGKTSAGVPLIKQTLNLDPSKNFVPVNADDAKGFLPEYAGWNAGHLHEESSDIVEEEGGLYHRAMEGGHNMILDVTGANGKKMKEWTEHLATKGYDVHLIHVKFPGYKSASRVLNRYLQNPLNSNPDADEPGRYVPPEYAYASVDGKPDQTYEELKQHSAVQSWTQVSTDVPKGVQPQMLDQGKRPPAPVVGSKEHYLQQAMSNLEKTSRTAKGVVDTSASAGKAEKMAVGSGEQAAKLANDNFRHVIGQLHDAKHESFANHEDVMHFADTVNKTLGHGIMKEGVLERTDDSSKFPYTAVEDLPLARQQFAQELKHRIEDPHADPVETAAWIEWRANLTDHFWADGVGKTAKALGAWVLMKNNHPLPEYRGSKEMFEHANRKRYDPKNGPESYLDDDWKRWLAYYRTLFPKDVKKYS